MDNSKKIIYVSFLIFFVFLSFLLVFVYKENKKIKKETWSFMTWVFSEEKKEKLVIKLISDKRNKETDLTSYESALKNNYEVFASSTFQKLDFSDDSVKEYLQKNNISTLPAIIFSTNEFDLEKKVDESGLEIPNLKNFLSKMNTWEYFLNIWAVYNPFTSSDRWLSILDKNALEAIKNDSFFENWNDKEIIWLEYIDLACPFCQKFANSGIKEKIMKDYSEKISKTVNNFRFHSGNHYEILECFAEQKLNYFSLEKQAFSKNIFKEEDLKKEAWLLWIDTKKLETCLSENKFSKKVDDETKRAISTFGIKSIPTSVFINSKTWEYKIISGFDESKWEKIYLDAIEAVK